MKVLVAYADPQRQRELALDLPAGSRLEDAIVTSGMLSELPGISLESGVFGVWGKVRPLNHLLRENDRVEIYRPLQADPKDARRKRAKQ